MQKKVKVALPAFLRLAREKSVAQGRGGLVGTVRPSQLRAGPSIKNYSSLISCSERPE
jgi:hypothetical protein